MSIKHTDGHFLVKAKIIVAENMKKLVEKERVVDYFKSFFYKSIQESYEASFSTFYNFLKRDLTAVKIGGCSSQIC